MKGFKKLALVAAIAAPMTSVHALEALDDSVLSDMTGQAGVTIDLETRVEIGSVAWTDTNEGGAGEVGGGTVSFDTVTVGGFTTAYGGDAAKLDDVRLLIDAAESGDLEILVVSQSGGPVDLGIDVGGVSLNGSAGTSVIASNINMDILLGPQKFVVTNNGASGTIEAKGFFQLADSSSMDIDVAGVSITGLRVGNFLGANAATGTLADPTDAFTGTDYTAGLGFAFYDATIQANASNQLQIDVNNFNADIQMNVGIGGASIGQITMTDFDVSGTQLTVYGH